MSEFDEEEKKESEKTTDILKEIEIDRDMLKNLTKEELEQYNCPLLKLEKLEGNYIEEFEQKVKDGTIEVSEKFQKYIEQYKVPLRGFDPRTGVYGVKYAAAGFFSAGCEYMEQEKYDEAIANFAKAIELQPRHIVARGYKANCYFAQEDAVRASAEVWNAIDLNPVIMAESDKPAADLLKLLHRDTISMFKKLLIEHLLLRGMSELKLEWWDEALADFDDITKRHPKVTEAYYGRIVIYMKYSEYYLFDEWDKIILNADVCIKAKFQELYAYECRGYAYANSKKYDEALADYNTVLAMNPDMPSTYLSRSQCYYHKKEYQKALDDAEESIRRGYDAYYDRGLVFMELGEYQKALADFDEALRRFDKDDEDYDPGDEDYITESRKKVLELMEKNGKQEQ